MTQRLPERPSLRHLHEQAKDRLAATYSEGRTPSTLDAARTELAEDYGFTAWTELMTEARRMRGDAVGDIPSAQVDLLTELSAAQSHHSFGSLLDHLSATRDLLAEWANSETVCAAGLFHSVYGTQYYKVQSASFDRRTDVAAVIGERAEELAYLFCVTDRRDFFTQMDPAAPALKDRVREVDVAVTPQTIDALIEIEIANGVEQVHPTQAKASTVEWLEDMLRDGEDHMSPGARSALTQLVQRCRAMPTS